MSDLKALIKELRSEVKEQKAQVQDLKAQINGLNAQVADQKQQVSAQGAAVQSQGSTLQQMQAQQEVIEKKQTTSTAVADEANPGYFMIPGTKTEMKIGGYVKLDAVDDVSASMAQSPSKTATDLTAIPLSGSAASHRNGQLYMTAQESRLNVATLTKTDTLGDVKTFIEGDFYNYSKADSTLLRLRHAYITAAGWTVGQTWSTFMDLDTGGAETLDFTGPAGYSFNRQAQVRYTKALPFGEIAVSVENPHNGGDIVNSNNTMEKVPDMVVRYTADPSWGHFALAGLGRYLVDDSGAPGPHPSKMTYGVLAGVGVKTFGKDMLVFQTVDGNGVGKYVNQGQFVSAILSEGVIRPINIWGGTVGYTHYWMDSLRSNVSYGYSHFSTPAGDTNAPLESLTSLHANVIWSPVDNMDVGLEYIYGRLELTTPQYDSATGTTASSGAASRLMGSVKYTF